ncbi:MAG: hypothetical protein ACYTGR_20065 [Planctomycetota bacterium]
MPSLGRRDCLFEIEDGFEYQGFMTDCNDGIECLQPGGNDRCEDAIHVEVPSITAGQTEIGATTDFGTPDCGGGTAEDDTWPGVWYVVDGTSGFMTASTCENGGSAD